MQIDKKADFVLRGNKVIHPPVRTDGLELYYDTKGKKNTDTYKNKMLDMSGNGRHGELHDFRYKNLSGYQKDSELVFDGVGDKLALGDVEEPEIISATRNQFNPEGLDTIVRTISGLKPNTDYTMSSNVPYDASGRVLYLNGLSTGENAAWEDKPITQRSTSSGTIWYQIYPNRNYNQELIDGKYWVQLEEGSTATPYVPYIPSIRGTYQMNNNIISYDGGTVRWVKDGKVMERKGINLVRNGNFANGTTGWTTQHQQITAHNGKLEGAIVNILSRLFTEVNIQSGHKYYFKMDEFSLDRPDEGTLNITGGNSAATLIETFSGLSKLHSSQERILSPLLDSDGLRWNFAGYPEGGKYEIGKVQLIDLTATFGAGNEPTLGEIQAEPDKWQWLPNPLDLVEAEELKGNILGDMEDIIDDHTRDEQSGVEVFTDKADDSLVRVEVDGKSEQVTETSDVVTDGLVHWLSGRNFHNNPATDLLVDRSGYGNHVTPHNFAYTAESGSDGDGGIVFDGVDDYLSYDLTSEDLNNNFTIETTFKLGTTSSYIGLYKRASTYETVSSEFEIYFQPSGYLTITANRDKDTYFALYSGSISSPQAPLTLNTVNTLTLTYDNGIVCIYTNGELVGSRTVTHKEITNEQPSYPFKGYGSRYIQPTGYSQKIYNRTLSAEEVQQNYQAGQALNQPIPDDPIEIHSLNDFDVVSSVGRRNLSSKDGWYSGAGVNPAETENGFIITRPEVGAGSSDVRIRGKDLDIKEENDYTLSFKVRKLDGELLRIGGHTSPNFTSVGNVYINGEEVSGSYNLSPVYEPLNSGEWHEVVAPLRTTGSISETGLLYIQPNRISYRYSVVEIKDIKLEEGHLATPYAPSLEKIEGDNHPLIDKINLSLSEPLRSVGDVHDRLFRDSDGLWKVERNVGEYRIDSNTGFVVDGAYYYIQDIGRGAKGDTVTSTHFPYLVKYSSSMPHIAFSGARYIEIHGQGKTITEFRSWVTTLGVDIIYGLAAPTTETLDQELQDKLNNLRSFQDSNYVYTITNGVDDLPSHISENLKPTIDTEFLAKDHFKESRTVNNLLIWNRSLEDEELLNQNKLFHERFNMRSDTIKGEPITKTINLTQGGYAANTLSLEYTIEI